VPRALLLILLSLSCKGRRELRGFEEPTLDGGTMLVVDDDAGGECQVFVDGLRFKAHKPKAVAAGPHAVDCGDRSTALQITVHSGYTYHFDSWGP
jgi:hypothetical protein